MGVTLLVLRHAKSSWDGGLPDRERPLSRRGERDARALGALLARDGLVPQAALVSPAERTRLTWAGVQDGGGFSLEPVIEEALYSFGASAALDLVAGRPEAMIALVGHGPTVEEVVERSCRGRGDTAAWGRLREKFPTSGVAVIVGDDAPALRDGQGSLVRFEVPRG